MRNLEKNNRKSMWNSEQPILKHCTILHDKILIEELKLELLVTIETVLLWLNCYKNSPGISVKWKLLFR